MNDRLTKLRIEKKRTQQEIANYLGITRPAYTAYESGSRKPDYEILEKIADYFDVSIDYLLGRTSLRHMAGDSIGISDEMIQFEEFLNDPNNGSFFKDYLSAPEEKKEELLRFWRYIQETEKGRKPEDKQGE